MLRQPYGSDEVWGLIRDYVEAYGFAPVDAGTTYTTWFMDYADLLSAEHRAPLEFMVMCNNIYFGKFRCD